MGGRGRILDCSISRLGKRVLRDVNFRISLGVGVPGFFDRSSNGDGTDEESEDGARIAFSGDQRRTPQR